MEVFKMSTPLTALNNTSSILNNSGTTQLAVKVPLDSIKKSPTFENLFPLNLDMVDEIAKDIQEDGYDNSQPVHIWQEENILLDGYTRLAASQKADLYEIPVYKHSFANETEALIYAIHLQINRRQLSNGEKLIVIEKLNQLKNPGKKAANDNSTKGKSASVIADELGMSTSQVENYRYLLKNGDEETIEDVKKDKKSLHQAVVETKNKQKKLKQQDFDFGDDFENDDDSNDEPKGLSVRNQIDDTPKAVPPEEDIIAQLKIEKNIQVENAKVQSHAIGFEKGLYFALAEVYKGRTVQEVLNDEKLTDLSPSVIYNFELPEDDQDIIDSLLEN